MECVSLEEWEALKHYVRFGEDDVEVLRQHRKAAETYVEEVVDALYAHLRSIPTTRALLQEQTVLGVLKRLQTDYFLEFTSGEYGEKYLKRRLRIGARHAEIGLSKQHYIGAYSIYIQLITPHVFRCAAPRTAEVTLNALIKLMHLDMGLAISAYDEANAKKTVEEQTE